MTGKYKTIMKAFSVKIDDEFSSDDDLTSMVVGWIKNKEMEGYEVFDQGITSAALAGDFSDSPRAMLIVWMRKTS